MHFTHYWCSRKIIAARNTCLKTSLILYYFMNRYHIPVRICIGVKKEDSELTGHSWIEDRVCIDQKDKNYNEFITIYSYPE